MIVFKRKIYDRLLEWKDLSKGRSALLVEGARRVGKSTIVEEFARNVYKSVILIDFAECPPAIKTLFDDISDLNRIFMVLQLEYGVELIERESVIIFDEVQLAPHARQAIKFLVKDGRYDYIETGSLISINENIKDILIPSEEEVIKMYPMDFEEFRWAMGDEVSMKIIRDAFFSGTELPEKSHQKIMEHFRLYTLVGGMPQAVAEFLTSNNLTAVDRIKRNIITLYEKDLNRIDPSGYASRLFHQIPAQLTTNANRYMTWNASNGKPLAKLQETIAGMKESMVVNIAYHANDPSAGLAFHENPSLFKMYVADTGLFVTLAFWDKSFTENVIYKKLLANRINADLGYLYENVVAQMLATSGKELYYYTFPTSSGKHNYEIDFIITEGHKISPIEVKSSGYRSHASLDAFYEKFSQRINREYLLYPNVYKREGDMVYLPFFMVPFL